MSGDVTLGQIELFKLLICAMECQTARLEADVDLNQALVQFHTLGEVLGIDTASIWKKRLILGQPGGPERLVEMIKALGEAMP